MHGIARLEIGQGPLGDLLNGRRGHERVARTQGDRADLRRRRVPRRPARRFANATTLISNPSHDGRPNLVGPRGRGPADRTGRPDRTTARRWFHGSRRPTSAPQAAPARRQRFPPPPAARPLRGARRPRLARGSGFRATWRSPCDVRAIGEEPTADAGGAIATLLGETVAKRGDAARQIAHERRRLFAQRRRELLTIAPARDASIEETCQERARPRPCARCSRPWPLCDIRGSLGGGTPRALRASSGLRHAGLSSPSSFPPPARGSRARARPSSSPATTALRRAGSSSSP